MVSTNIVLALTAVTVVMFMLVGVLASRGRVRTVEDFIAARDSLGSGALSATVLASMMGAWILFSPAEAGAAFGGLPAILGYAIGSAIPLVLFVPVGRQIRSVMAQGHSLTEFAYARFGSTMYAFILVISVFYMFIFLAAEMTGITGALALVAGVPRWQTALLIGGFVLVYTAYGGLIASMFTDTVQTLVILPFLAIGFAGLVIVLGGAGELHAAALATDPTLVDPTFRPGLEFGVYVAIAILGANMLNQGLWQRVYAADGDRTLTRGFTVAAVLVVPMVLLAGLFGVAAAAFDLTSDASASIALFLVLEEVAPTWLTLVVVILAILLVMSSADTMLNAIASVATADLARLAPATSQRTLWMSGRGLTIAVAVGAIAIGAQGYSVLELFLTADLLAAAVFVPFLAGLFTRRLSGGGAIVASLAGLITGVAYFPTLRPWIEVVPGLPPASFLLAFVGAAVVSSMVTAVATALGDAGANLDTLDAQVRALDEPIPGGGRTTEGIER